MEATGLGFPEVLILGIVLALGVAAFVVWYFRSGGE